MVSGVMSPLLADVAGRHRDEVLPVLDFDHLVVGNADPPVTFNSRQFIVGRYASFLLDLESSDMVSVKFNLHLTVAVDFNKNVNSRRLSLHLRGFSQYDLVICGRQCPRLLRALLPPSKTRTMNRDNFMTCHGSPLYIWATIWFAEWFR